MQELETLSKVHIHLYLFEIQLLKISYTYTSSGQSIIEPEQNISTLDEYLHLRHSWLNNCTLQC